ncbi:hypothetical protein HKCCSP123_06175 [Rhodobacterales bacterium HKCCSP123]|nr:hypothetical protein [Rhodobacterales bacterium HKCCSP123]
MSDRIPQREREVRDAVNHLRKTLERAKNVPVSMERQICQMVGAYARRQLRGGGPIYPGMKKMAEWGQVTTRQARTNYTALVNCLVVVPVQHERGGKGNATEWIIDYTGLKRWLVHVGANPHPTLLDKLSKALERPQKAKVIPLQRRKSG